MLRHRMWRVTVGGCLPALVFAVWLFGGWGGPRVVEVVDDLGLLAFAGFGASCCLWAATSRTGRGRRPWLALSAGLAAWTAGEAVWCYFELWRGLAQVPFPSVADLGFLLFPVGAALALVLFPYELEGQSRIRLVMDGLLIAGSLYVVSWLTVLGSVVRAGADTTFALVVSLAYPVFDLVIISMLVVIAARAQTAQRLSLGLLGAGVGLIAASDSAFVYLSASGSYDSGNLIDIGWAAGFVVLGLAAASASPDLRSEAGPTHLPGQIRLWFPYLPVLLAGAVGLPQALPHLASSPVLGVGLLLVMVLLARQLVTLADNRRLLLTVAHQAFHDPLTGLANRALFSDRLNHAVLLHQRDHRPVALLCIDLDGFKQVNDSLGHPAGDELLIRVAERLTGCLRATDTLARLGGDEFAVLIHNDASAPVDLLDRITEAFTSPFILDGRALHIRPSLGLATLQPGDDLDADHLLKIADAAMYADKADTKQRPAVSAVHTR
jgi:diguanylate cyclase